jgi:hypothetical protein
MRKICHDAKKVARTSETRKGQRYNRYTRVVTRRARYNRDIVAIVARRVVTLLVGHEKKNHNKTKKKKWFCGTELLPTVYPTAE